MMADNNMQEYKTYLYVVRDSPALRVKYGYVTAPHIAAARSHLKSRYSTYLFYCELLHVVPVAKKGVDAEKDLKERLMSYYLGREFLSFPDEATLQTELRLAFTAAACPEEAAASRHSRRGATAVKDKRIREEAEMAAAVEVAVIAKKRKLEYQLERKQRAVEQRRLRAHDRQTKANTSQEEQNAVHKWVDRHVAPAPGSFLILTEAYNAFQRDYPSPIKLRQFQKKVSAMLGARVTYDNRASVQPNIRKCAWIDVRMDLRVSLPLRRLAEDAD